MEKYLSDLDIDVYICEDTLKIAQGKEKEMLDLFNNMPIEEIATITKLNQKQITAIINKRPYSRFWLVGKTSGIGKTSYNKLFNYFYNNPSSQMKLF
jgi:hypothetical protein